MYSISIQQIEDPLAETDIVSIHGRDSTKLIRVLKSKPQSLAIITDSKNNGLEIIRQNLLELNLISEYDFWLCEELDLKKKE